MRRAPDTVELWQKVTTVEDAEWTRRYHSNDPAEKAFGGRVEITSTDGERIVDEIAVADAHPLGARPFARADYVRKFRTLADGVLDAAEIDRFLGLAERLPSSPPAEVGELNVIATGLAGRHRRDCSDAPFDDDRRGEARRLPREARERRADPDAGGVQPAVRAC